MQLGGQQQGVDPGPYTATPGSVGFILPDQYIFSGLPPATSYPAGTLAFTQDSGFVYGDGSSWTIIGSGGTSVPANILAGVYTYATLPSAALNPFKYACTTDSGGVFSNGVVWQILFNPTNATLQIATNSPLPQAQTTVAYSFTFQATQGTPPYVWSLVSKYGSANAWAINSSTGALTATPGTAQTDTITVQVVDATGASDTKTVSVLVSAAALTPAATPTFSPVAGTYNTVQSVSISCSTPSSTIYYTTNGSAPSTSSTVYSGPISVNATTTIRAIATAAGFTQSAEGSALFTISLAPLLPAPRFGTIAISANNSTWITATAHNAWSLPLCDRFARLDLVDISGYSGCGAATSAVVSPANMQNYVNLIKSKGQTASGGLYTPKVFMYFLPDSQVTGLSGYADFVTYCDAQNWYVYNAGTAGTKTKNYFLSTANLLNVTTYAPADANGDKLEAWATKSFYNYHIAGTYGGTNQAKDVASSLDGLRHDNFQWRIPAGGGATQNTGNPTDWNRDGVAEWQGATTPVPGSTIETEYANGMALSVAKFRTLTSTKFFLGNLAAWGSGGSDSQGNAIAGATVSPILSNLVDGGFIEGCLGISYAPDSFSGGALAKQSYQRTMAAMLTTGPKLCGPCIAFDSNGQDFRSFTDGKPNWQGARYQLAFAMMDDGYAWLSGLTSPSYNSSGYHGVDWPWLDEMTVQVTYSGGVPSGTATGETNAYNGKGWLGFRADPAWTQLGNGVYAVRYNLPGGGTGIIFCNFKANGAQTFNIATYFPGKQFKRINGTQAPSVNSGAVVSSVTLDARDGLFGFLV